MAKRGGNVGSEYQGPTDGTYGQLNTPLNVPKAEEDPQAPLENSAFPGAKGEGVADPLGILDLTGPKGRRGDPR